jgi:3-phenylpropionate/trans-cinnamate dioxygenase ferredoxin reductase subunit
VRPVTSDIVELRVRPAERLNYLPGQYFKLQFRNYPARCYSPTVPMTRGNDREAIRFHIRQISDGRVSPAIGYEIGDGHKLTIEGPYGNAYLRPGMTNRLVLVSSGTGFAPIWSIAAAALKENPERSLVVIASVREMESLYMIPAFRRIGPAPNVKIIPVVSTAPEHVSKMIRRGRPTDHMPDLQADDTVYACGGPEMVDAIREKASASGAAFYADPFVSQSGERKQDLDAWAFDLVSA